MRFYLPLLIILLATQFGCDQTTGPAVGSVPSGRWVHDTTLTVAGEQQRQTSVVILSSTDPAFIRDTSWTLRNSIWEVDSTVETVLKLDPVGDGYLRTVESRRVNGGMPDSTLRYWYFFSRNDSLYFYRGMRFLGKGLGLVGNWAIDSMDTAATGLSYSLHFTSDSVEIQNSRANGPASGRYSYQSSGSLLTINNVSLGFGSRYEVVPGTAFYSTTTVQSGYRRQR
jgi:hypothetical protein